MTSPVTTAWIDLNADGFGGHLALPPGGRGPGLLLLQEIFGVNAHIRAVAQQYALDGFVVLAPDDKRFAEEDWSAFAGKLEPLYCGGQTRRDSVYNGLVAAMAGMTLAVTENGLALRAVS